jgi:ABC-type transporter Mla subunit MlaD
VILMARLPVPGPRDLLRLTTGSYQALEQAIALVPRLTVLVGQLERIAARAETALDGLDRTRQRADEVSARADALVGQTGQVVAAAQAITGRAGALLDEFEPTLDRLVPVADRLAATTSPAEVDAIVLLVDTMPELVDRLRKEILPILASMTNVAPDVRELLDTTKEFTAILGSLPGLGRIKRRIEEHEEEQDRERAEIEATVERP